MIDVYVLDKNLKLIGIVDAYKSLIWANRYAKVGDCELYLGASRKALSLLQEGNYLVRTDDEMICRIRQVEIDTDAEDGDYLIITGYDMKQVLDQRIIWTTETCDGQLEPFVRDLVTEALINPTKSARKLLKPDGTQLLYLDTATGIVNAVSEQVSYKNLGEKVREYCQTYQYGYRVKPDIGSARLLFGLYVGTDRSDSVVFSEKYENLSSTKYEEDSTELGNVALIGGQGDGADRIMDVYGEASGLDRYEHFVDAKDISPDITFLELTTIYPPVSAGGQGRIISSGGVYTYRMDVIDIMVMSPEHLAALVEEFPGGTEVTIDGQSYYELTNLTIADLPSAAPEDGDTVTLRDVVYDVYLLNRGSEKLAEYGKKTTFEGQVVPDVTFVYKKDYFLGDIVRIENEYGISASARIIEVVEVMDETGYKMEPKFEYLEVGADLTTIIETPDRGALMTESDRPLLTQESILNSYTSGSAVDGIKISQLPEATSLSGDFFLPVADGTTTKKVSYDTLVDEVTDDVLAWQVGDTMTIGDINIIARSFSSRTKINATFPLTRPLDPGITGISFGANDTVTIRNAGGITKLSASNVNSTFKVGIADTENGDLALNLFFEIRSGTIGDSNGELLSLTFNTSATITFT